MEQPKPLDIRPGDDEGEYVIFGDGVFVRKVRERNLGLKEDGYFWFEFHFLYGSEEAPFRRAYGSKIEEKELKEGIYIIGQFPQYMIKRTLTSAYEGYRVTFIFCDFFHNPTALSTHFDEIIFENKQLRESRNRLMKTIYNKEDELVLALEHGQVFNEKIKDQLGPIKEIVGARTEIVKSDKKMQAL